MRYFRFITLLAASLSFCVIGFAQVPEYFNWQAVIRDNQGEVLSDSTIEVRLVIEEMGILDILFEIYSEDHVATTNEFGLVSLSVGTGDVNSGEFDQIKWDRDHYLAVWINLGNGFVQVSEEPLSAVPFAMLARDNWTLKGNYNVDPEFSFIGTTNNAPLRFKVYSSQKMIIGQNGRIGVGLDDPLSVRATMHLGVGSDASLTNDDSGFLVMGNVEGANMVLDQNEIIARSNGSETTLFLNTSGGAVVVNQNTWPGFDFTVNGSAAKPGGGSWGTLSDARMKENVSPFSSGLDLIRSVKPVSFHYNEKSGYDTQVEYIGVIAQDLQQVAPFMVEEKTMEFEDGSKEDYLTVDPSAFTYLLINAVKELEMQNESQSKIIDDLARQNQELLKRIEALEKK
jgi:hypothetical protein